MQHNKNNSGFITIPILIAILLGTVVVGGGSYYVVKEISKPVEVTQEINEVAPTDSTHATSTSDTDNDTTTEVPGSSDIIPSSDDVTIDGTEVAEQTIKQNIPPVQIQSTQNITQPVEVTYSIPESAEEICDELSDISHKQTLDILTKLCAEVREPFEQKYDFDEIIEDIYDRWDYYQVVLEMEETQRSIEQRNQTESTDNYSEEACLDQKEDVVDDADEVYLEWFDDWQNERAKLDSCYNSNSVPYCDKQMTEINVEWQEKISEIMKSYQDNLTLCAPSERFLNDVSDVISSPY
ncbi:hypothetical protein GW766_02655 [Candidatus Parcubacteria bacterium]|nr:hypothetical protein [Candidatus Parcubacteria bacterium]